MDILIFIADQTMYLIAAVLPDANPKQIRLLLLSVCGFVLVLMMFAIMWSMLRHDVAPDADTESELNKAAKVAKKSVAKPKIETVTESQIKAKEDARIDDAEQASTTAEDTPGGFSVSKRETNSGKIDAELISIEQEMLAIRQLYLDDRITKDVYVFETRRLYEKASESRSDE